MTLEGNISDWTIVVFIGNNSRDLIFYTKLGPSRSQQVPTRCSISTFYIISESLARAATAATAAAALASVAPTKNSERRGEERSGAGRILTSHLTSVF